MTILKLTDKKSKLFEQRLTEWAVVDGVSDKKRLRREIVVKELLTTAKNQRYIRFKKQARYKLR